MVANTWTAGSIVLGGQTVTTATLAAKPTVTLVFLRLPDGGLGGAGYASTGNASLPKLDQVTFRVEDGGTVLAGLTDGSVDLLFLDAERTEYASWWPHPVRVLRSGGVLVADNAESHADEIAPLRALVEDDDRLVTTTISVGKGELVALRR